MKLSFTIDVDYTVYKFYEKVAKDTGTAIESIMSEALFMYAGIVALDIQKNRNSEMKKWEQSKGNTP